MKRRILSLLLALCLIVGLLPMAVLAEDAAEPTATLTFKTRAGTSGSMTTWTPALTAGMSPVYAKTTEEGTTTTEGASATDWNIKIEWNLNDKPTLTLKDANLVNDALAYVHTITIGGSADFVIQVEGNANTISDHLASTSTKTSQSNRGQGICAENTGTLTIRGTNKRDDGLVIDNKGGHCIVKKHNALIVEDVSVKLQLWNTASYTQSGIVMSYGDDKAATDLSVIRANLHISVSPSYHSNNVLIMAGAESSSAYAYASDNTGDILFKDSMVRIYKSNSTSSTQYGSTAVRYSKGTKFTIDNSDVYFYGRHALVHYLPDLIENCTGEAYYTPESGTKTPITEEMYEKELIIYTSEGKASTITKTTTLRVTHTCQKSDPVTVTSTKDCQTKEQVITYCKICDKILENIETDLPTKAHTPGTRLEYDHSTDAAGMQYTSGGTYAYSKTAPVTAGKRICQYVCGVCGEIYTKEESFQPAFLYYGKITKNEGADNEVTTYGATNFNATWNQNASSGYIPCDTIKPGTTVYFKTTENRPTTYPGYFNMIKSTSADWNIKFEYPLYGDPVMTLKDATIINAYGLWYSFAAYTNVAPLTIVLEGDNVITHPTYATNGGAVNLRTTNPVTITGSGTLNITADCGGDVIRSMGDLNIVDTTINIVSKDTGNSVNIISVGKDQNSVYFTSADLVIKNSTINILCFGNTNPGFGNGIAAYKNATTGEGGNITIENSNIIISGTADDSKAFINAANDLTITTSELHFAHGYATTAEGEFTYEDRQCSIVKCGGTLTTNYIHGLTGNFNGSVPTKYDVSADPVTTTYPESLTEITDKAGLDSALQTTSHGFYLDITPSKMIDKFDGVRIGLEENLVLEFALDITKVDSSCYAEIVRTRTNADGTTTDDKAVTVYLKDAKQELDEATGKTYYVIPYFNIAAKEIQDKITVTVYNADGIPVIKTKTDSVCDYAVRMLRGDAPTDHTAEQFEALKTVLVDLLSYCAMAQVEFDFNLENLATKVLTPSEWAAYATTEMAQCPSDKATLELADGMTKPASLGATFELNSKISMLARVAMSDLGNISYALVNGKKVDIIEETIDDVNYAIFFYANIIPAEAREDIVWQFCDADGNVLMTVTDSLKNFIGRNAIKNSRLEFLMKYCDAADAYFDLVNAE